MLTLGRPISLTAAADAVILPASFGEKIKANYAIMAAAFTPKELLFLLVNPPEAPYTGGDVFNFAVERSDRSTLNMAVDIVNNIVNRVLLEDKSTATYQDSVYIDMALRKLGIENVALFMEQARALRSETLNTRELIRLYQENPPVRRGSPAAEAEARRPAAEKAGGAAEDAPAARREYYLHNEIFRRLDTARIIASLARFAHSSVENYTRLGEREMLLAEYERSALTLTLNEYRRQTGFLTGGDIFYHRNHYELGDILPAPAGEKEVLEQATAAALLQLIDSALNCRTENYLSAREQWLDLRIGLYQTAQNSLRRFISFHEESAGRAVAGGGAAALPALALLTELEAITLARQPQGGPPPLMAAAAPPEAEGGAGGSGPAPRPEPPAPPAASAAPREVTERLAEIYREQQAVVFASSSPPPARIAGGGEGEAEAGRPPAAPAPPESVPLPDYPLEYGPETRLFHHETLTETVSGDWSGPGTAPPQSLEGRAERSAFPAAEPLPGKAGWSEYFTVLERERLERQTAFFTHREYAPVLPPAESAGSRTGADAPAPAEGRSPASPAARSPGEESLTHALTEIVKSAAFAAAPEGGLSEQAAWGAPPLPPAAETAGSATPPAAATGAALVSPPPPASAGDAILQTALERIDRENRERMERLRETVTAAPAAARPRYPDKHRIMRAALSAALDPAAAAAEAAIAAAGSAPPPSGAARAAPAAGGAEYLSHIDETSRRILDSLRLLREDPAAAAAAGVRLQDGPAALMAEVAAVEQERQRRRLSLETAAPAGTAAPAAPGPAGRPGDGLYEAVGGSAARPGPAAAAGPPWAQSSLVHRRPETLPDEETQRGGRAAAAEIERNLAKQEQTAQAAEIRAETSQTAQNLTAGTAEDITELINTTLRRQIGMITEQVYGQLERKLQNEKARRGRM